MLGLSAKGYGTFAEYSAFNLSQTAPKPQNLSFAEAGALPVAGATAYDAVNQIPLEPGQTLVILGAGGGVGLMAAEIAQAQGLNVLGVARADKQELIEATGATFVDTSEGLAGLSEKIRAAAPDGVELMIDLAGGALLKAAAEAIEDPSRIISTADPDTAEALGGVGVERTKEGIGKVAELAAAGKVTPRVSARFDFEELPAAIAALEEGKNSGGKIVMER